MRLASVARVFALAVLMLAAVTLAPGLALASAPAKKVAPPDGYFPFEPITVSVLERMRVKGLLTVEFGLYVKDEVLRHRVEGKRRVLSNAYVRMLVDFGSGVATADTPPDLKALGARLQRVTDSVLGKTGARILFSQAQLRRVH